MTQWPAYHFAELLARLPASARRKYNALLALVADSEALMRASFARQQLLQDHYGDVTRRLEQCDPRTEPDTTKELREELDIIRADLQQLDAERNKREGIRANAQQVIAQLRDGFIPNLIGPGIGSGPALRTVVVTATPRKGESVADAILRVRAAISSAQGELQQVKAAPPPPDEIKRQLRAHVQQLIHDGTPRVVLKDGKVVVNWPDVSPFADPDAVFAAPAGSASKLLACLFPDKVYELLSNGVDDLPSGIAADERAARMVELEVGILELEHEEESLVTAALAAGVEVYRRPYASPWALLGLAPDDTLAAAVA
jgi:hypothetical protein